MAEGQGFQLFVSAEGKGVDLSPGLNESLKVFSSR
jgi:hypothetical protein